MTIYYLYIKTHKITGLKYLGQTSKDPYKYSGSGIDWIHHLKLFGNDLDTEILLQTEHKEQRNYWGRYYSRLLNIVTAADDFGNKIWANRIPETGGGGGDHLIGVPRSDATKQKIRDNMPDTSGDKNPFFGKTHTDEIKVICGLSNLGKDIKTSEGKKSISSSMTARWEDPELRKNQIDALKSRKGEKRSKNAIKSYKKAAVIRDVKMTAEERSARSKKAGVTRLKNQAGYRRQRYFDENGKMRFRLIPVTPA